MCLLPSEVTPDLGLIEQAFSKVNALFLRGAEVRTSEALGTTLCAVTVRDGRGFFTPCGYRIMIQLL